MVDIKSIVGKVERLTGSSITRKNSINGEKMITVNIPKLEYNEHAYSLVKNENILIYKDEEYVIKKHKEITLGTTVKTECVAIHKFFDDFKNKFVENVISGRISLHVLAKFVTSSLDYRIVIDSNGLPEAVEVENFGWKNALALFKEMLSLFGTEFDLHGKTIYVAKEITRYTDYQMRYQLNMKDPGKEIDTSSFATRIKGYGKQNEDGSYSVQAEYISPLATIYGLKDAEFIKDDKFTDKDSLLEHLKQTLNDGIDITIKQTLVQLKGLGMGEVCKGDYVWCTIDPFDIDVRIRVSEIEDFSDTMKSPNITLGTIRKKASDIIAGFHTTKQVVEKNELMSTTDKQKLNQINIQNGQVVDLSFLVEENNDLRQLVQKMDARIKVLEGNKPV
jgi:phage minor structural protein